MIAGQLPEHGDAYYRARIEVLEPGLKEGAGDADERIDLAAAYLRLGRYEQAEAAFLGIEADYPELYQTQAFPRVCGLARIWAGSRRIRRFR